MQTIRRLTIALFLSGLLNLVLITLLGFWVSRDAPVDQHLSSKALFTASKPEWLTDHRNALQVVEEYRRLPLRKLIRKLRQTHLVEDGFTRRDLALAVLAGFHQFDFARSILPLAPPQQVRVFLWKDEKESVSLRLYPDLTDEHFARIIQFGETEQWPYTVEGIFYRLQEGERDEALIRTFLQTPPFRYVQMLFQRGEVSVEADTLLALCLEGSWPLFAGFYEEQKRRQDFSALERQQFLYRYVQDGSRRAAAIVLETDFPSVVKKWHDQQIASLFPLLEPGESAEKFAYAILTSPRNQRVCEEAARFLYRAKGIPAPEPLCFSAAIQDFAPHVRVVREVEKRVGLEPPPLAQVPARQEKVYVVQEGDSLWKIAKRTGAGLEEIKARNHLESDVLRPGKRLLIP